ncbi:hypothetical protein [Mesorhizobium amorphae]
MKEETGFEALMHAVCVGHGYCGGMHGDRFVNVTDLIPKTGTVTADQFVDMLLIAEYENEQHRISPMSLRHRDIFKAWFIEHMGSDAVDASRLRSNE